VQASKAAETFLTLVLAFVGASLPIEWKVALWVLAGSLALHVLFSVLKPLASIMAKSHRWLCIVLAPVMVAAAFHEQIREKRITEHSALMSGVLTPEDASIPWQAPTDQFPVIVGGDSPYGFQIKASDGAALGMDTDTLKLQIVDGKVELSTMVRDQSGNTVVQITNNHWIVSSNPQQSWDKNYDDHALEVLDGQHQVIFQVRLYKNGVRLQGRWYGNRVFDGPPDKPDPTYGKQPLFKYPSNLFWGERSGLYMP
jgi:hypothetical protein